MKTAGYDFVAEVNENLVNRAIAAAYYTTLIPAVVKGSYNFTEIPPGLSAYARVDYELRLKEPPTVDGFIGNKVRLLVKAEAVFRVLGGLRLEFDVRASVEASPTYDQATRRLTIDLKEAMIEEVEIGDEYDLEDEVVNAFNRVIRAAITSGILDNVEKIELPPVLYDLELPEMPPGTSNQLKVGLGNLKVLNQNVMAVCIDFLGYTGGNIAQLTDFSGGLDFCGGISEAAMHRIFDFWWDRTTHPKRASASGRYDVPILDDVLDTLADIGIDLTTAIATAGFVESDVAVEESWIDYSASVSFGKPSFDLKVGNTVTISNCPLVIDVTAKVKLKVKVSVELDTSSIIPDSWTPWDDDVTLSENTYIITLATFVINSLNVNVDSADAAIYLDDENRLVAKVESVDVTINLGWSLPDTALNWIIDQIESLITGKFPALPLSPALITENVPGAALTLQADIDRLTTDEDEAIVGASITFKEMSRTVIPVPKYVANRDPLSLEVHRADCQWVDEIHEKNKVGYYVLMEALKDGYDGCKYCLPKYHTR